MEIMDQIHQVDQSPIFELENEKKNGCDIDDNFVLQDYLDVTNSIEVPQVLFSHVEESVENGLEVGMMLEVPHKTSPNSYWVASIAMPCGPLLRLKYVGLENNRSHDFWCDITKITVHSLGWCKEHNICLVPPSELGDKGVDVENLLESTLSTARSVPVDLLTGDGITPVERIKQGMKIEVQDKRDPHRLWVATVIENVGGRLLLRYDTPDSTSKDFWLFFSSPRLFRIGWVEEKGSPWVLRRPNHLSSHHGDEVWAAIMEMTKEDARRAPLPPDLFQHDHTFEPHGFEVGMKLEAVHPHNMVEFCPATVTTVFSASHFLVKIDSHATIDTGDFESVWLCTARHSYIFPVGWAKERGLQLTHPRGWTSAEEEFDWSEYLEVTGCVAAPRSCFSWQQSAESLGFVPVMKLEAVNPENQHQICAASIEKTLDHLLWIHLESNDDFHPSHIVSVDSLDIFPVGWCESNSYPLKPPCFYQIKPQAEQVFLSDKREIGNLSLPQQRSCWCPKIYFNHKCFSGPFLSKGKLAQLPKAVGPGPVTLVMREVLAMLISVAYKSSRVLKELQCDSKPKPGMHLEVLKAKYKTNTYRASVAVVTSADKVPGFCKEVCSKLQVCPYMFGPVAIKENACPESCSNLSKSKFSSNWGTRKRKAGRPKTESGNLIIRPAKKRGRRRFFQPAKPAVEVSPTQENAINTAGNESDGSRDSNMVESIGSITRYSPEVDDAMRRKYRKKQFPRSEIKTRGAKLPNFALQMRHWTRRKIDSNRNKNTMTEDSHDKSYRTIEKISVVKILRKKADNDFNLDVKESSGCSRSQERREYASSQERSSYTSSHERCNYTSSQGTDIEVSSTASTCGDLLELGSNPLYWSKDDVYRFLSNTADCYNLAQRCKDELIDGHAFMLLNLPTIQHNLLLKLEPATNLCQHIERVKLAYYLQYVSNSEP